MRPKERIKPFLKYIEQMWLRSPDLRFGQLLINMGIVEDGPRTWHAEIVDYPIPHKHIRKIQTWGIYGKGKENELRSVYIEDLGTVHIKDILKTQKHIKGTPIEKILKEELKYRKKHNNYMKGGKM